MIITKFFFYFISFHCVFAFSDHGLNMVVDIINSYSESLEIAARVCWKSRYKIELFKRLNNQDNAKLIQFVNTNTNLKYFSPENTFVIADYRCPDFKYFMNHANNNLFFAAPYRWLIIRATNDTKLFNELHNYDILPDSEVIIPRKVREKVYNLTTVYKIESKGIWRTELFGTWDNVTRFRKGEEMGISKTMRRKNLHQLIVPITFTTYQSPLNYSTEAIESMIKDDHFSKVGYIQYKPLYMFLNASVKYVISDTWGYYVNGTWTGMISDFVSRRAELSGTLMFITEDRLSEAYYITPPMKTGFPRFIFRDPPLSSQSNLYILPFSTVTWLTILAFVLLLLGTLYLNARLVNNKDTKQKYTIGDVAFLVIGAISQQGSSVDLKGAGRVQILVVYSAFLFLFTAYSASIVVLLQSSSNKIRTLSDLLNSNLEIGAENSSYTKYWFKVQTDPIRQAIYKKIYQPGSRSNFMEIDDGIKKMQKQPFAFHTFTGHGYKRIEKLFLEDEKCGLLEIAFMIPQLPWYACRKSSPYKEIYKVGMSRLMEHGMLIREEMLFYSKKPKCTGSHAKFASVSIIDVYPILLMLLYGFLLSFVLLIVEIIVHRHPNANFLSV